MIEEGGEGRERGGGEGGETVDGRREEAKQAKRHFPKLIRSNLLENMKLIQGREPLSMGNWLNCTYILFSFARGSHYLITRICAWLCEHE